MNVFYDGIRVRKNSGQIAVFILLIMLIGLTIGLAVVSRTIQDLKQTAVTDQSGRAFSAAEAGLEKGLETLRTGSLSQQDLAGISGISQVNYSVTPTTGTSFASNGPVANGEVISVNLDGYTGGTIKIFWGKSGEADASLVLSFYTVDSSANYSVVKYAYNPPSCSLADCNSTSSTFNYFDSADSGDSVYKAGKSLTVPADTKLLRIRPIYNNTSIKVEAGSGSLPAQGYTVTSTAQTVGGVSRAVQVSSTSGSLPPFFDYVLYAKSGSLPN